MATKYSDAIKIRETKSAYNIETESDGEWKNFIPNEQFNSILQTVVSSVSKKSVDEHRSFWIEGTYGTGKSHAAAVIKHLLCDPVEDITDYLKDEYGASKYDILRQSLMSLRSNVRLLPVTMYGQCSMAHSDDLSLQIQSHVHSALEKANINVTVKTDFDNFVSHIESQPAIWDNIILNDAELQSYAPDRNKLIKDLKVYDSSVLTLMKNALRNSGLHVRLEQENLCKWFFEVQDELARTTEYSGILLIWDEFTDVMTSDIVLSLLVDLQKLAEGTMDMKNNSYFFHIAHPSALDNLKAEDRTKTMGRYRFMKYNMEPVSAFKIMSRKFIHEQDESTEAFKAYHGMTDKYFAQMREVYEKYASTSNNPSETVNDLKQLFPVHPSTANLATYYAREAGSSSRSVFEFLGSNPAIRDFLDNEQKFTNADMITSDYLWDFVLDEFNSKVTKYGIVTERFNSYRLHVANKSEKHLAVFKSILLLNALNNIANHETVTPSEENIRNMYVGTPIDAEMDDILSWINDESVVQRSPQGIYEIRFSALDTKEIETLKAKLLSNDFKYTSQILHYGDSAQKEFDKLFKGVNRPYKFDFYSEDTNEHTLLNKVENGLSQAADYEVFMALMMARTNNELASLKAIATKASADDRFKNVAFLVFDAQLGSQDFDRFIEYQANALCANQHGFADQTKSHTDNAKAIISDWVKNIKANTCTLYIQNDCSTLSVRQLPVTINTTIAPRIFSKGPESCDIIRLGNTQTYWVKQHSRGTADNVLSFNTKDDISSRCTGPAKHMSLLLQDSVDDNLNFKSDIDKRHPLYVVFQFVKSKIEHSDKTTNFNLADKLRDLTKAPYGLFPSHSGYGLVSFALKPYVDKVFDTNGKPINAQRMLELVADTFKIWENGGSGNNHKVDVKFETKEEGSIAKGLISLFKLNELKDYKDVSSLTDTRWALRRAYCKEVGYPLWTLKHSDKLQSIKCKDKLCKLTDNIIAICEEIGTKNPALLSETDSLLTEVKYEYATLLDKTENYFENGFHNFLLADEIVNLSDNDYNDAVDYIRQHMELEAGLWKEAAVIEQLKNWRIATSKPVPEPENENRNDDNHDNNEKTETVETENNIIAQKKDSARERIKKIGTIQEAKRLLETLCDLDNITILDAILKK